MLVLLQRGVMDHALEKQGPKNLANALVRGPKIHDLSLNETPRRGAAEMELMALL